MPVFCRQGQALGLSTQGMNSALTSGAHSGANMFLQVFPFCLLAKKTSDTKLCFRKYPFSLCLYAVCRIIDCRPSSKACFSGFEWVKHHVFFFFFFCRSRYLWDLHEHRISNCITWFFQRDLPVALLWRKTSCKTSGISGILFCYKFTPSFHLSAASTWREQDWGWFSSLSWFLHS